MELSISQVEEWFTERLWIGLFRETWER